MGEARKRISAPIAKAATKVFVSLRFTRVLLFDEWRGNGKILRERRLPDDTENLVISMRTFLQKLVENSVREEEKLLLTEKQALNPRVMG